MRMLFAAVLALTVVACTGKKVETPVDAGVPVVDAGVIGVGTSMTGPAVPTVLVKPAETPAVLPTETKVESAPEAKPVEATPAPVQNEPVAK